MTSRRHDFWRACERCDGQGQLLSRPEAPCPACWGTGLIRRLRSQQWGGVELRSAARTYALVAMRHIGQVGEEHSSSLHRELAAIADGLADLIVEARKLR